MICVGSVALFASCAKPLAGGNDARRRRALDDDWPECRRPEPPPVFPDAPDGCPPTDDPHDHGPATCVPEASRGPELAYDEALRIRVFRACERTVEGGTRGPVHLDRHRVLIERTGPASPLGRHALSRFLGTVTERLGQSDLAIRRFTTGECPETGGPDPDAGSWCAVVALATTEVDPPKLMSSFAAIFADADPEVCVPIVVALGVPEPCPQHLLLGN